MGESNKQGDSPRVHAVDVDGRIWHLRVRVDRFDVDVHVGAKRTVARDGLRGASLEQRKVAAHGRTRDQSRRLACPAETTDGLQVVLTRTTCKLGSSSRSCHHIRCSRCCRARPPCLSQSARGLGVSACQPVQSNRRLIQVFCDCVVAHWCRWRPTRLVDRAYCRGRRPTPALPGLQQGTASLLFVRGCTRLLESACGCDDRSSDPRDRSEINEKAETRATIERTCVARVLTKESWASSRPISSRVRSPMMLAALPLLAGELSPFA